MFGNLKEKLKKAIFGFGKRVEELPEEKPDGLQKEDAVIENGDREEKFNEKPKSILKEKPKINSIKEEAKKETVEEKKISSFFEGIKERFKKKEPELHESEQRDKKGVFEKIKEAALNKKISDKEFNEMFHDLEIAMLENNVAYSVVEKIKEDLREKIVDKPIKRSDVDRIIEGSLKNSIESLLDVEGFDFIERIKGKKDGPFVIMFIGVNGVGKTTAIAKISKLCQNNNLRVIIGAGDCFRKGSIEQLEEWGKRLGIRVIKHDYHADPAAVCFDAIKFGEGHNIDVVLLDTAGRQHSNKNLMEELSKINRVAKPDLKMFVAESLAGSDAVEQAVMFNDKIGIDCVLLTKADVDEKGGAIISIGYVVKKPVIYLGVGQEPDDLIEFNKENVISSIGL